MTSLSQYTYFFLQCEGFMRSDYKLLFSSIKPNSNVWRIVNKISRMLMLIDSMFARMSKNHSFFSLPLMSFLFALKMDVIVPCICAYVSKTINLIRTQFETFSWTISNRGSFIGHPFNGISATNSGFKLTFHTNFPICVYSTLAYPMFVHNRIEKLCELWF